MKHAIIIIGLLESYHFLYQPLWAHCQTRMRMQSAYRRQFVYSVESSSPSNPIAVFFSLAPPLAYCGRAGGMSRSPPRRLGARSLPKQIHLLSSLAQVPTSSSSSSSNAPRGPAGDVPDGGLGPARAARGSVPPDVLLGPALDRGARQSLQHAIHLILSFSPPIQCSKPLFQFECLRDASKRKQH